MRTEVEVKQAIRDWINKRRLSIFQYQECCEKDMYMNKGAMWLLKELETDLEAI